MFQFRPFPSYAYLFQRTITRFCRAGFPHSEICGYNGYLLLPAAYRSLSRPSSAPDAKAFPLRSLQLDLLEILVLFSELCRQFSEDLFVRNCYPSPFGVSTIKTLNLLLPCLSLFPHCSVFKVRRRRGLRSTRGCLNAASRSLRRASFSSLKRFAGLRSE